MSSELSPASLFQRPLDEIKLISKAIQLQTGDTAQNMGRCGCLKLLMS